MSLKDFGERNEGLVRNLETFEWTASKIDAIMSVFEGDFRSRQALSVVIVLLERIEALERRLEANGIYE